MQIATYTLHRFENNADARTFMLAQLSEGKDTQWSPFIDAKMEMENRRATSCDVLVKAAT